MRPGEKRSKSSGLKLAALTFASFALVARPAAAQTAAASDQPAAKVKTVLDDNPVMSARGAALGGALVTNPDDLDAAFYNPAGIGGLDWKGKDPPTVRKVFFPWFGASANQNSSKLVGEMRSSGAASDPTIGKAIVDANAGDRQYARGALVGGLVLGRTMVVPFSDLQVAATGEGNGSNLIDMRYRTTGGIGAGTSVQDSQGRISLGYFAYRASRTETSGEFLYDDMIDKDKRSAALKDKTVKSTATGQNAGIIWKMGKTAAPTLGIALKNIGDTVYSGPSGTVDTIKEDLTTGFSVTPIMGKLMHLTFSIEADRLNDEDLALKKKFHGGLELAFGGFGSYATFSLRAGASDAGGSGGLALNLGLIAFEAALQSTDIGAGNEKVIERRVIGITYVNVAEF